MQSRNGTKQSNMLKVLPIMPRAGRFGNLTALPFLSRPDHFGLIGLDLPLHLDPVMDECRIKTDAVAQQSIGLGTNSGPGAGSFRPLAARAADPFEKVGGCALSLASVQRPAPPRIT